MFLGFLKRDTVVTTTGVLRSVEISLAIEKPQEVEARRYCVQNELFIMWSIIFHEGTSHLKPKELLNCNVLPPKFDRCTILGFIDRNATATVFFAQTVSHDGDRLHRSFIVTKLTFNADDAPWCSGIWRCLSISNMNYRICYLMVLSNTH